MGELREWIELLLIPVLIPVYFAARKAWRQWKAKRDAEQKRTRRETRRADIYETEGTEAINTLAFENQELQLELEASELARTEARQMILNLTESTASWAESYRKLADAYQQLAEQKVVES